MSEKMQKPVVFSPLHGLGLVVFSNTGWAWGLEHVVKRLFVEAMNRYLQ
jgi:hypothetical protein